jgi:hypothetical protein
MGVSMNNVVAMNASASINNTIISKKKGKKGGKGNPGTQLLEFTNEKLYK